jgi:hypothetical protein
MHTRLATTTIVAAGTRRTPVKNRLPDHGVTVSFAGRIRGGTSRGRAMAASRDENLIEPYGVCARRTELMDVSRRNFIVSTSAAAAGATLTAQTSAQAASPVLVAQAGAPAPHGFDPKDPALKYDLVIANGDVLDPSQKLRGRRDIGIKHGQIAAIESSIAAARAVQRVDAAGKLVTPGLVDLHTHLVPHLGIGLPADELVGITAVTTAVSAGDAGWQTFGAVRHFAIPQARTRIFAFVHIASIGLAGGLAPGEMLNIDYANVDGCAKAVIENPDIALGVKVRITDTVVGQNGLEPLRRAIRAAEMVGKGVPVMCHLGSAPGSLSDLLDLLRPADVAIFDLLDGLSSSWTRATTSGTARKSSFRCSPSREDAHSGGRRCRSPSPSSASGTGIAGRRPITETR